MAQYWDQWKAHVNRLINSDATKGGQYLDNKNCSRKHSESSLLMTPGATLHDIVKPTVPQRDKHTHFSTLFDFSSANIPTSHHNIGKIH
jgi:hypothetical protein